MYYEYREPVRRMPAHRILAVNRGEREEVLRVRIEVEEEEILPRILKRFPHPEQRHLKEAVEDGYKRLLAPSVEREIRGMMTEKAEEQAIRLCGEPAQSAAHAAGLRKAGAGHRSRLPYRV